ncbi:MAG: class I SAM-dependent methyltransferase [Acidimicrobiia bacterium]
MESGSWDERYRVTDRLWSIKPNLFVADRLGPAQPGVGLDLASGEGRNAIWLSELGWTMTAVDFSEVAVERGRAISNAVDFVVADVLTWEPSVTFDLVLIAYLHLPEDQLGPLVKRAVDWLKPDGEIFLIGHDRSNIEDGHGGPQIPEILWNVESIRSWLSGLTVIEAQVVRRPIDTDDGVVFARDTLVRARATPETAPV